MSLLCLLGFTNIELENDVLEFISTRKIPSHDPFQKGKSRTDHIFTSMALGAEISVKSWLAKYCLKYGINISKINVMMFRNDDRLRTNEKVYTNTEPLIVLQVSWYYVFFESMSVYSFMKISMSSR